jgi:predicted DNA-binding transcriptional regulator YafY
VQTLSAATLGRGGLRTPSTRPPLRRLFWALGRLTAGEPFKATDVARTFEVGLRTAYRDLDFLRDAWRIPFDFDRRTQTFRLTSRTAAMPAIPLSEGELVALFFAEKVLRQYKGTPYEKDLESAFQKIQALLPDQITIRPERLESYLSLDLGPLPAADADVFRDVVAAVRRGRRLLIRYKSNNTGRTLDRTIEPHRIFNLRGNWYVAAYDHRRKAVRDFALHRIRKVTITEESIQAGRPFDFRSYMTHALGIEKGGRVASVAIRFSERQARWIRERRWHKTQRIQDRLDGGCVLRMRVAVTGELVRWVMQFGAEAEVLAPKTLRREVAEGLGRAVSQYVRREGPSKRRRQSGHAAS